MTKETIFEILGKLCRDGIGQECLWEFVLNSLMRHERSEWLAAHPEGGNKGNGYRPRAVHIGGARYAVRIPRDRRGLFRPFLLEFLRLQDEAQEGIVSRLYACGMTTRDIGATLRDLYGRAYAPSSVSRMLEATAADVEAWLARALPPRVPVLYIDCLHARVARGGAVAPEAFYVALGVFPDGRRGVLGIGSRPTEGAGGWAQMLEGPRARGLDAVGVVVADGLKGLADAVAATLPGCTLQRCTVHLRRNCLDEVRKADRARMREDLDRLLRVGDPGYTPAQGWRDWGASWPAGRGTAPASAGCRGTSPTATASPTSASPPRRSGPCTPPTGSSGSTASSAARCVPAATCPARRPPCACWPAWPWSAPGSTSARSRG